MRDLAGTVAIVTGASSGQGEAIARRFVADGAQVVLADLNQGAGEHLAAQLGGNAVFQILDVASEAQWAAVVQHAIARFGKINALINNAGIYRPMSVRETSVADWTAHYSVNQLGVFLGMRAVIEPMIASRGGSIVNTSSNAALRGTPGMFAYCTTKWAIRGMSKSAAADLAPHNIRVNTVLPGIIDTPMYRSNGPEKCALYDKLIPLGRRGQPEEVANLMAFLVSDEGSYFSGAELTMDGAMFP